MPFHGKHGDWADRDICCTGKKEKGGGMPSPPLSGEGGGDRQTWRWLTDRQAGRQATWRRRNCHGTSHPPTLLLICAFASAFSLWSLNCTHFLLHALWPHPISTIVSLCLHHALYLPPPPCPSTSIYVSNMTLGTGEEESEKEKLPALLSCGGMIKMPATMACMTLCGACCVQACCLVASPGSREAYTLGEPNHGRADSL